MGAWGSSPPTPECSIGSKEEGGGREERGKEEEEGASLGAGAGSATVDMVVRAC